MKVTPRVEDPPVRTLSVYGAVCQRRRDGLEAQAISRSQQRGERSGEAESIRALQIVEYTYRKGVVSAEELATLTGASASAIERSVKALRSGGLRIDVDDDGRCRVRQEVPGFALRLTEVEAAAAWGECCICSRCPLRVGDSVPAEAMEAACLLLERALRKYYPDSEALYSHPSECGRLSLEAARRSSRGRSPTDLTGEARAVDRRLRILELALAGQVRNRRAMAEKLGVSTRTITRDLTVMKHAGLKLVYRRRQQAFWIDCMHTFLVKELSSPAGPLYAAALSALFDAGGPGKARSLACFWHESVSRKMTESLKVISVWLGPDFRAATLSRRAAFE